MSKRRGGQWWNNKKAGNRRSFMANWPDLEIGEGKMALMSGTGVITPQEIIEGTLDAIFPKPLGFDEAQRNRANVDPEKGLHKGGKCNVTACQRPPANHWNKAMNAWYCRECAAEIDRFARMDGFTLFDDL